jgi:hypothetical protein
MFDELFDQSFVVARYQNAPHAESRANFLKKAREEGYPISTLERIAWALLVVAHCHSSRIFCQRSLRSAFLDCRKCTRA